MADVPMGCRVSHSKSMAILRLGRRVPGTQRIGSGGSEGQGQTTRLQ